MDKFSLQIRVNIYIINKCGGGPTQAYIHSKIFSESNVHIAYDLTVVGETTFSRQLAEREYKRNKKHKKKKSRANVMTPTPPDTLKSS